MGEPRDFYYPLQDDASDIDRVVHDLVEITDDENSLGMYVKVIEQEGKPHFWFGEGGEKQKPIEVDEWEVPIGDGQDWVKKSCIYAPHQIGVTIENMLSQDQIDLVVLFTDNIRQWVSSGDPPAPTTSTFIRRIGVTSNYKSDTSDPSISPYYFGRITETFFKNLFNDSSSGSLSIYASVDPYSINSSSKFYLCDIVHDEDSDSYNVFLTYNEQTYKIANISYESETKRIVIERFYNNNYGSSPDEQNYQRPALKFMFSFRSCNGAPFNFNLYNYYFGLVADDAPYQTQKPATIYWEAYPNIQISSPILSDESQFYPIKWLSTNMTVIAGIYSIGVKPERSKIDVLYIGPLENDLGPASEPSGNTIGITLKQGGNLAFERTVFDCQDGRVIFKGGHIDLNADGDRDITGSVRAWDGTRGGLATNKMRSGEPLVVMHGDPLLQMLHESTLHMTEGASIEMDGETLLSIHDLTKIDISGAPYIQIHGRNNESGGGPIMKYGLSARQPRIELDSGPYISMSGNEASTATIGSDPYFIMKGSSGIIFNNLMVKDCSGPLLLCNENSFYFDGYGSGGIASQTGPNPKSIVINLLDLSLDALNEYREYDVEKIVDTLKETNLIEATESNRNTLTRIVTTPEKSIQYFNVSRNDSFYTKQVGEELEYFLKNKTTQRPYDFQKYYYVKASKYNELRDIIEEINDPRITMNNTGINMNLGSDLNFYGNSIIEDKFIEKGLNFDDFIFDIGYYFWLSFQLNSQFVTYYKEKYGTTTLPQINVVYSQPYSNAGSTIEFLNKYFDISFADYADINEDETYFSMTGEQYDTIKGYYDEYNENKDNPSFYFQEEGNNFNVNKKRFIPLILDFYRTVHPAVQEKFYSANGTFILGGDDGSTTWAKIGGQTGEHTEFGVLNNAKVWIENKAEVKLNGEAWLNIDKEFGIVLTENKNDYLLPSAAQFVISPAELIGNEWTRGFITISDRHDKIAFTIDDLRQALNGGSGGASSASQVSYDNTTSGLIATDVQDAIDELAARGGGSSTSIYKEEILWDSTASTDTQGQYTLSKSFTDFDAICVDVKWTTLGNFYKFVKVLSTSILKDEIGTGVRVNVSSGDSQYLYVTVQSGTLLKQVDTSQDMSMNKIYGIKYGTSVASLDGVDF